MQMNEFREGHVKVPSLELFILHIAKSSWPARGRLSRKIFPAKSKRQKHHDIFYANAFLSFCTVSNYTSKCPTVLQRYNC